MAAPRCSWLRVLAGALVVGALLGLARGTGHGLRLEARRWSDTIVAVQQADGGGRDAGVSRLVFDGQRARAFHDWAHTTAWSVTALGLVSGRDR